MSFDPRALAHPLQSNDPFRKQGFLYLNNISGVTFTNFGLNASTATGTAANGTSTYGQSCIQYTSAATSGSLAGTRQTLNNQVHFNQNPSYISAIAVDTTTDIRIWTGLFSGNPTGNDSLVASTVAGIGFRFSTGTADTNWQAVSSDVPGANETITDTGIPVTAGNVVLSFSTNGSSEVIRFFVDLLDGNGPRLVATHVSTDYNPFGGNGGLCCQATTLDNVSAIFAVGKIYLEHN